MTSFRLVLVLVATVAVPPVLSAQERDGDVSRGDNGRILHRRSPEPGQRPVSETPVFVYEPGSSERDAPTDLIRDGVSIPRPSSSTAAGDGELVHTPAGLERPPPKPSPAATPAAAPAPSVARVEPLPASDDANPGADEPAMSSDPIAREDPSVEAAPPVESADPPASPPEEEETAADPRQGLGSEAHPDRDTEREGTLHYTEVFDPSVVPFKRNRALDTVGRDYVLRTSGGPLERLEPIGNRLERGREVFWGSLLLEGEAGRRIPIASVSPESQILSYEANPPQVVTFERDRAGNYYATPERSGRMRLVFVTDAPATWFGRILPRKVRASQVPRALRPTLPRHIRNEAIAVARAIGITPRASYIDSLERLVAWFRAFEPGEPPPVQGSVYRDIALGKRGICRHRGHGFVITAQALGIPARYVFNEAHVFVEVYIPGDDAGWLRIDLGGGADELQVHGGEGKSLHQPLTTDPFEQPPSFAGSETAGAERVVGLSERSDSGEPRLGPSDEADLGETLEAPIARARPAPDLVPTKTTLEASDTLVFRGDRVLVRGSVSTTRGGVVPAGTVQVLLARGPDKVAVALLGTASIDNGRFAVEVLIPARQSPGQYEIIAEYLGDGVHAPSVGE